ncbi:MAG: UbiA prenyltransferase family protein [Spirochaetes bacterium]|nr:UbiA prenyltransferase family protein [Spirochaetota bacterium]
MEEYLFFGERLTPAIGISMTIAYFHLAIALICILKLTTNMEWKRIQNAVYLGIFLGAVPPLIDVGISGFNAPIIYRYYVKTSLESFPWHFYAPDLGAPKGETIVVWISILFTGLYAFLKSKSWLRFVVTSVITYGLMLIHFALVPIMTIQLAGRPMYPNGISGVQRAVIPDLSLALLPFWYIFFSVLLFLALRPVLRKVMVRRMLHLMPYALVTVCGGQLTGGINTAVILAGVSVFLIAFAMGLQNDYFDARHGEHRRIIEKSDMDFFNIAAGGFILWMILLNQVTALPLLIFFGLGILYSYPIFRLKKFFPGALKVEGLAAVMAFVTGVMVFARESFRPQIFVVALLIFGGWSVLASWKDLKDIRRDTRLGYKNLYTFIMGFGASLSRAHRINSMLGLVCIMVPVVYATITAQYMAATVIFCAGFLPLLGLTFFPTIKTWFKYVLLSISAVLIECTLLLRIV